MTILPNQNEIKEQATPPGFSLIESLITLSLFLFILAAALEVFMTSQNHFNSLKESQENYMTACAALDKIKTDIRKSGLKLAQPAALRLIAPVSVTDGTLTTISAEKRFRLDYPLVSGQTFLSLSSLAAIKKGNDMCIFDKEKGEVISVALVDKYGIQLAAPLTFSYGPEETTLILLHEISYFLDANTEVLRRKVNSSPAQPLCENVREFVCSFDAANNLAEAGLKLNSKSEQYHEIFIFPENPALASGR